jgi:Rrf2 family iron-sulfur cluster assembly transcriptional regulator
MILSTKGRYAVMAMVELAARKGGDEPVTLAAISETQEIPLAYLEQIFAKLRKRELVQSVRGPGGGYKLARAASDITIADIILGAEEAIRMTRCDAHSSENGCMAAKTRCMTHDLWDGLGRQIFDYLSGITLDDVVARRVREHFVQTVESIVPDFLAV